MEEIFEYDGPTSSQSPKHYLVVDGSNILYRAFFVDRSKDKRYVSKVQSALEQIHGTVDINLRDGNILGELAIDTFMSSVSKHLNNSKADEVILCFDKGKSWRFHYTKSDACLSQREYKGNRRQKMTPDEMEMYENYKKTMKTAIDFFTNHTGVKTISVDHLEGDDIIAEIIGRDKNSKYTIVSTDKDLTQLIADNVTLLDPATGKPRDCDDVDYFLFLKCFRGDVGDNVMSAYPRLRETKIQQAFKDEFQRINLMQESWKDHEDREFIVGELFKENELLMDLTKQPEDIKRLMKESVDAVMNQPKKVLRLFTINQSCNTLGLTSIPNSLTNHITWICG